MRKFLTLSILSVLFCVNAHAMQTPLFCLSSTTPSVSATNYMGFASSPVATNDQNVRSITSMAGVIEGLYVDIRTAPGAAKSYTYTIQKNGADTAITCQISGAGTTTCSDAAHSVKLTAGDNFSLKIVPSGTPTASVTSFSTIFNSGTGGASLVYASANSASPSTSATETNNINGNISFGSTNNYMLVPTGGTISKLYVLHKTAPGVGASGKQYVWTITKNGTPTALTCTVFETATTCNDTSNSFSVVANDSLRIQSAPTNTPAAPTATIAVSFTPTIDGESIYAGVYGGGAPSASVDNYQRINGYWGGYTATESSTQFPIPMSGIVAKKLYVTTDNNPGTSKSYTHALRVNAASSALTCTRTGNSSATNCSDTTHTVTLTQGNLVAFLFSPSGTPTAPNGNRMAVVLYIDPKDKIYGSTLYDSTIY